MMFSVVSVVLNDADGILKTANSIIAQSNKNYEWIIIDGGSHDETLQEIKQIQKIKPIVYSEIDNGIYDAMNKGIDAAKGEYLIFMNAGDSFANQYVLEILEHELATKLVDVVLGGTYQHINNCMFYRRPKNINWIVHGLPAFHQSTVYKTALLRSQNYSLDFILLSDYEWLSYRCSQGVTVGYLNYPISNFFVGGLSYTNIWLKFKESYRIKYTVLRESKLWSIISAIHAVSKTLIVMYVLYMVCGFFKGSSNSRIMKYGRDTLTIEYYKHPKSSGL
ncbi:MAG: glycosyltransferase [Gammaproteobacteria bacterium]|nr:glycosyltransferase [Gammaproteobacteria bacterium]MCW8922212.1 glycosyltransferase [Gammaproteobacteria bacterium]